MNRLTSPALRLLFFCSLLLTCRHLLPAQTVFHSASSEAGGNWYSSSWLGDYYNANYPWIYHEGLGWLYTFPVSEDSFWGYSAIMQEWMWLTAQHFPLIYQSPTGWVYLRQNRNTNYLYIYDTLEWLTLENLPGNEVYREAAAIARFLDQATLGADYEMIQEVCEVGIPAWIDAQMALPMRPLEDDARAYYATKPENHQPSSRYYRRPLWQRWMTGEDQLRMRVTLALSEIFVISDHPNRLSRAPVGIATYYDVLQRNAFGNFRDLLMEVTMHPVMGFYLSHAGNQKSDPSIDRYPDENYAREVMQLFSIGLFELNPDGSRKVDDEGNYIPTYTNREITEFAKVFTGIIYDWSDDAYFDNRWPTFERVVRRQKTYDKQMLMVDTEHEPGSKQLLNGLVLSNGQNGMEDVEAAIDNLFNHPNTGPFIIRLLIQRLIKSNPSPNYIKTVADVFADNGEGVRGDMAAVIKAIYMHPEARSSYRLNNSAHGKLREPYLSYIKLFRVFNAIDQSGLYIYDDATDIEALGQQFFASPSVFNFFLPDFQPIGEIADRGLVAPEFQIVNSQTIVEQINTWHRMLHKREIVPRWKVKKDSLGLTQWEFDWTHELALAANPAGLVDRLDLVLTAHCLSETTREIIINTIAQIDNGRDEYLRERVEMAVYLILLSPDFVVQR